MTSVTVEKGAVTPASVPIEEPSAPSAPIERYKFDGYFQTKIAALVVRDAAFVQRTDGLIRPEYFESQIEGLLVDLATSYFKNYKKIPADRTIYYSLIKEAIKGKRLSQANAGMMVTRLNELYDANISDRDYVIDQVATFARHQAVAAAMHDAIFKLDKRDFDGISKLMRSALDVGAHVDTGAYDFDEMMDARLGERKDRLAGKLPPVGITTGYKVIDETLHHKGWGRRELSVIMGGAKAGKTTALMDFGINAFGAGNNVLYITLEVAASIIAERMDANISQIAMNELGLNAHKVHAVVRSFIDDLKKGADSKGKGKFVIHEFPSGSFTVQDLRRLIERYKGRGILFDMVIVDYADLMAPERYTDSSTENSKSVYVNLRGLAMMENFALLTATQTNRQGFTSAVARAEHVAEDFNKIRIADVVISINATDEERAKKQARLFYAACRNQPSGFAIRVEQDIDRMKFISKVLGHE